MVGSGTETVADALPLRLKKFGAVCDGVADDTATLVAADAAAVATGRTLVIDGTPLIKSPLTFSGKSRWRFEGATGVTSTDVPPSHFVKHSSVAGDLLTFTGNGVVLENLAIVGQLGNTGNGVTLLGNSPRLVAPFVTKMGAHGIRIGKDTAGANVNSFVLENPRSIANLGCGIYVHDESVNANAGSIINPICTSNGSHGFYGNKATLGVTIICPTFEANTGWGAYFDAYFGYTGANVMLGGDIEANVAGNLYEEVPYQNLVIGTSVQGKTNHDRAQMRPWTPVLSGASTAGVGTYSVQEGEYEVSGATVHFSAHLVWSLHDGTGQAVVSLPIRPYSSTPNIPYSPVVVVALGGYSFPANAIPAGFVARDANRVNIYYSQPATGTLGAQPIAGAGELYVRGSYPLNAPNFFTL